MTCGLLDVNIQVRVELRQPAYRRRQQPAAAGAGSRSRQSLLWRPTSRRIRAADSVFTQASSQPDPRSRILSAAEISQDQIADPGNKRIAPQASHYTPPNPRHRP